VSGYTPPFGSDGRKRTLEISEQPSINILKNMSLKVIVIGGVAAGPKAAAKIMRLDPQAEVTILEKGKFISYAGCGLPYYVSGLVKEQKDLMDESLRAYFRHRCGGGCGFWRKACFSWAWQVWA